MDCESCGRHRPSEQVVPARSMDGTVLMACCRCRRHFSGRVETTVDLRSVQGNQRQGSATV